jgi:hypothetical protein
MDVAFLLLALFIGLNVWQAQAQLAYLRAARARGDRVGAALFGTYLPHADPAVEALRREYVRRRTIVLIAVALLVAAMLASTLMQRSPP